jgi:hypothetical protein
VYLYCSLITLIITPTNTPLDSPTQPTKALVFTGLQHCVNQQLRPTYRGGDSADLLPFLVSYSF